MVQIFGKLLDKHKYVQIGLKNIYGFGIFQIALICSKLNIGFDCRVKDLTQTHVFKLLKEIEISNLDIEINLKKNKRLSIKRLIDIKSNRGMRHIKNQKIILGSIIQWQNTPLIMGSLHVQIVLDLSSLILTNDTFIFTSYRTCYL
jgi:small subunit ribosomal protein S13